MTCIVAVRSGGDVVIGGDRASIADPIMRSCANSKVYRAGGVLVGVSGTFRLGQLLQVHWPEMPNRLNVRTLVTEVVPTWQTLLRREGMLKTENGVESMGHDASVLIASRDGLFTVYDSFCVVEHGEDYTVTGSGWQVALGALHATPRLAPAERVLAALEAAAYHVTTVTPPFDVLTL